MNSILIKGKNLLQLLVGILKNINVIGYFFIQYIKYLIYRLFKYIQSQDNLKTEKEIKISQIAKSKIYYDLDLTNILQKTLQV
ncbi:unnamed protein product [Paramecium sonneborni]|uniref:Transmembrane protein n=1 Tax=Paramecium sonneborni TaxID=65129 RepID=A0A8S1M1Z1_9CILI|nr:unnamed protein product [Paramecium sonneborni]